MATRIQLLFLLLLSLLALNHLRWLRPERKISIEGVLRHADGAVGADVELQASRWRWLVDRQGNQFTGVATGGQEMLWLRRLEEPLAMRLEWSGQGRFRILFQVPINLTPRRAVVHFVGRPGQEVRSQPFDLRPLDPDESQLRGSCGFLDLPPAPESQGQPSVRSVAAQPAVDEPEETDMSETGLPTSRAAETESLAVSALEQINTLPIRELSARARLIQSQPQSSRRPLARLMQTMTEHRQQLLGHLGRALSSEGSLSSSDSASSRSMSGE